MLARPENALPAQNALFARECPFGKRSRLPSPRAFSPPRPSPQGVGAVERELSKLERSGLVSVERIGNQRHYRANRDAPIFEELQSLVVKTLAEPIKKSLQPYADAIKMAFVYG